MIGDFGSSNGGLSNWRNVSGGGESVGGLRRPGAPEAWNHNKFSIFQDVTSVLSRTDGLFKSKLDEVHSSEELAKISPTGVTLYLNSGKSSSVVLGESCGVAAVWVMIGGDVYTYMKNYICLLTKLSNDLKLRLTCREVCRFSILDSFWMLHLGSISSQMPILLDKQQSCALALESLQSK